MNFSKSVYVKRNFQEETGQMLKDYRPNQKIQKSLGSRISESIKTFLSKFIQNKQRNSIKVSINSEELVAVSFDQTDIFREFSVQSKVVQEQDYSLKPQIQEPPQKNKEGKKALYSFAKFAEQQKNKKYQSNLTKKNQNFLFKQWLKKSNRNKKPKTMQNNKYKDKHVNKKSKLNGIKVQLQIMLNRKLKKSQLQNSLTENSVIDFGFININHHPEERDLSESSISEDFRESMIQKVSKENEQSSFMEDCLLIDYSKQKKQLNSSFSYYNKESLTQVYPQQDQVINNQYETTNEGFITQQPNKEATSEKKSNILLKPIIKDQQLEVTLGNKDVDKTEKEVVVPPKSILEIKDKEIIQKKEQDLILNSLKSTQTPLFSFFNHNVIQNNEKVKQNIQQETNDQLIKVIPSFLVGKQNNIISPPQKPQNQSIFGEIKVLDQFNLDKQKFDDNLSQPSIESIKPQQQQKSLFSDLLNVKPENSVNQFIQSSGQGIFSNLIFKKPESIGIIIKPSDKSQEIEPQPRIIPQAEIDQLQKQPQQSGLFNKPLISPTVYLKPLNEASKPDTSDDKQIFPSKGLFSGFLFNKPEPIDTLAKSKDKKQEFELSQKSFNIRLPQAEIDQLQKQPQQSGLFNNPLISPTVYLKPLNEASKPDTSDDKQIFPSKGLFSKFLFNKPEPIDTLAKSQDKKQEFELRPRRTAEVQIDVDEPQNQHPETITQLQTSSFGNVPLLNQIYKPEQQSINLPIQSQELITNTREKTYLTPQKDSVINNNNPFLQSSPDIDKEVMNKLFAGNLFQPLMQGLKQDSTQQAPQTPLFQSSQFAAPQNPNPFIQTKENLNISFTPQQQPNFSLFGNNFQQQVQQQQNFQQPQQNTLFTQNQSTQNSIFGNIFTSQQQMIPSQHTSMYVNQTAQPSNNIYNPNTSYSQYSQDQSMDMDDSNNRYPSQLVQVAPFNTNQGLFGAGQQQQGFYNQQNAELFQPAQQQQQNQSQSLFGPELENKRVMNQNDIYGNQGNNKRKQKQRIG